MCQQNISAVFCKGGGKTWWHLGNFCPRFPPPKSLKSAIIAEESTFITLTTVVFVQWVPQGPSLPVPGRSLAYPPSIPSGKWRSTWNPYYKYKGPLFLAGAGGIPECFFIYIYRNNIYIYEDPGNFMYSYWKWWFGKMYMLFKQWLIDALLGI